MRSLKLTGIGGFWRAGLVAMALAGATVQPLRAEEVVVSQKNYKIHLADFWKKAPVNQPLIDGAYVCDIPVCGVDVLFVVAGVVINPGGNLPRSRSLPEPTGTIASIELQRFARETVGTTLATVNYDKELVAPTVRKYGPTKYLVTAVTFVRGTQPTRAMMIAQAFHMDWAYQFQFFSPETLYKQNLVRFEQVLESFDLLKE